MTAAVDAGVDGRGYARMVEPFRHDLPAHCYRMLGTWDEAEDMVQVTLLRPLRLGPPAAAMRAAPSRG